MRPVSNSTSPTTHKLAKLLARAGYGSRRDCERLIRAARVRVDGVLVDQVAARFAEGVALTLEGEEELQAAPRQVWAYHKPRGLITSHRDPEQRPTVFDALPKTLGRVVSVGRLDLNSEGLLLLTNDGSLAGQLERSDSPREYRVRMRGVISSGHLDALQAGVVADGVIYAPIEAEIERRLGANSWLRLVLREGKNREIRCLMRHFGYDVNRLIRTSFAGIALGNLPSGQCRSLGSAETEVLLAGIV